MKIQNKKIIFLLIFLGLFIALSIALASTPPQLLTDWPPSPTGRTLTPKTTIAELVAYIYEWGIALGGLIVFIVLLIAGFNYITSVGNPGKMKDSMERIKSAFLGLILLLSSWLILHTINPELTTFRPLNFVLDFGLACNTNADCPDGHICVKNIVASEEEKGGICVSKLKVGHDPHPCEFVRLYGAINFQDAPIDYDPWTGEPLGTTIKTKTLERTAIKEGSMIRPAPYLSAKPFRKITDEERAERDRRQDGKIADNQPTYNGEGRQDPIGDFVVGGACSLQLFGGAWWGIACGDKISETFLPHHDFTQLTDRRIHCLRILCRAEIRE